jgi:tripartite-type tricarboxylate transporter receptor subunit TctC
MMKRLVLVLALVLLPPLAHAQAVRIVVPFPPGGGPDALARLMSPKFSEHLGAPVVVDNRPGANGIIAAENVMKSAPDGTSLFLADTSHYGINPALRPNLPYAPLKDFVPVIEATKSQLFFTVGAAVPANNLQELVALSKNRPDGLHYGSSGSGSVAHLAMELLKLHSGGKFVHVPYKGVAQVVPAVLAGDVAVVTSGPAALLGHHKAGRVRMLATVNPERWPGLPEIPTAPEAGFPGVRMDISIGLLAPAGTPRDVVRRLNEAAAKALRPPEVSGKLSGVGLEVIAGTPEQFEQAIRRQLKDYAGLVKASGAKVD